MIVPLLQLTPGDIIAIIVGILLLIFLFFVILGFIKRKRDGGDNSNGDQGGESYQSV
jgi:hypothetical protein